MLDAPRPLLVAIALTVLPALAATACPIPAPCEKAPLPKPPVVIDAEEHRAVARTLREAIGRAIIRDAVGGEKSWGKQIITPELGEELSTIAGLTLVQRGPQGGRAWIDTRNAADHPQILLYRIRWFNGKWSKWHVPGVNDRDWKDLTGRVWRYFTDHEHQFIVIEAGGPMSTRQEFIGFNP